MTPLYSAKARYVLRTLGEVPYASTWLARSILTYCGDGDGDGDGEVKKTSERQQGNSIPLSTCLEKAVSVESQNKNLLLILRAGKCIKLPPSSIFHWLL